MSRDVGVNLTADIEAAVQSARYLIRVGDTRLATGADANGNPINWNGFAWLASIPVLPPRIAFSGPYAERVTIVLPHIDPNLIPTFTNLTPDTIVEVHATAALASYAGADDVVTIYDGVLNGAWSLKRRRLQLNVAATREWGPPWSISSKDGFTRLTKPGVYRLDQDVLVLTR